MKHKANFFRGMTSVFAFLMALVLSATTITFQYAGLINGFMGIETTRVITDETAVGTMFYENEYGYDAESLPDVYADAAELNANIVAEGTVLLKNDNSALPLDSGSKITLFGYGIVDSETVYQPQAPEGFPAVTLVDAIKDELGASNVNDALTAAYTGASSEIPVSAIKSYEANFSSYGDAAIVVFSRTGGEGNDVPMFSATDKYADGSPRRSLDLGQNEEDLIRYLVELRSAGTFKRIIAIVATDWQMELDWIDEYGVDAALLVGKSGTWGTPGIARILSGAVNPSGKTVDTYAVNSLSAPATTYAAENYGTWANAAELMDRNPLVRGAAGENTNYYIIYAEGIYVGYKYYETRYEDTVLGTGNAASEIGSSTGAAWNYDNEVSYTFGYGLSYTTFEEKLDWTVKNTAHLFTPTPR